MKWLVATLVAMQIVAGLVLGNEAVSKLVGGLSATRAAIEQQ